MFSRASLQRDLRRVLKVAVREYVWLLDTYNGSNNPLKRVYVQRVEGKTTERGGSRGVVVHTHARSERSTLEATTLPTERTLRLDISRRSVRLVDSIRWTVDTPSVVRRAYASGGL